jgi:hypothetical protein
MKKSFNLTEGAKITGGDVVDDSSPCCSEEITGEQACECIKQDLEHRVIPTGTIKLAGQERLFITTTGLRLTRAAFMAWSKAEGLEVDPIVWFTEMGHKEV